MSAMASSLLFSIEEFPDDQHSSLIVIMTYITFIASVLPFQWMRNMITGQLELITNFRRILLKWFLNYVPVGSLCW
jgi:hypothetical protein